MIRCNIMWKVLSWVGYILGGVIALIVVVFGALHIRYNTQSEAIHTTVDAFIAETKSGTIDSLQTYVHPEFLGQVIQFLNSQGQFFTRAVNVKENRLYFDYSWKWGVGEATVYRGTVTWNTGETGDYDLKLVKKDGVWVVYGLNIQPHSTDDNVQK